MREWFKQKNMKFKERERCGGAWLSLSVVVGGRGVVEVISKSANICVV
jgi:hypothetical protein